MAHDTTRPKPMQRPGGRTEVIRKAVASAVLDLLGTGKLDFTVLEVAERSGVGRRTVHRRWPNRLALLREALAEHHNPLKVGFSGSFQKDLYRLAVEFRDLSRNPHEFAINRLLASTEDAEFRREVLADFQDRVTKPALERFRVAQEAGDITDEIDATVAWLMLGASIVTLSFIVRAPPDNRQLRKLVAAVMRMCRP